MSTEIAVSTLAEQMEFARMVTAQPEQRGSQSLLPEAYRGNPANVLIAVGLGQSMGLSYSESLYRISVIKGKPTAAAELISANVRKAGHRLRVVDGIDSSTASIWRCDDPDFEWRVTRDLKWAQEMGLASSTNYQKQLMTMLQWRSISACARLACPEALYGVLYVPGEVGDFSDEPQSNGVAPKRGGMAGLRDAVAKDEPVDADVVTDNPTVVNLTTGEVRDAEPLITKAQSKMLHTLLTKHGMTDRTVYLPFLSREVGRELSTSDELTRAECSRIIDAEASTLPDPSEPPPEEPT